ncbi:PE family protein, partial [Mycobacterium szulgai]|nr:PE family protein [Mycobacterium szulgai]
MSFLIVGPDVLTMTARDLTFIGSGISAANATAAASTTSLAAAAADEVSAGIAALFGVHGQGFQTLSAQAAAFHDQFVRALTAGASEYVNAEAAGASPLQLLEQGVLGVINAPTQAVLGRPLIGDGANGRRGPGSPAGRAGCCSAT